MDSSLISGAEFLQIWLLALPLVVGGIIHMVIVKMDILSYLKKPIHHSWFGANKTWRGFLVMPLATWPGVVMSRHIEMLAETTAPLFIPHPSFTLALVLGLAYCLAELPNSFLKRRLGILEGQTSSRYKWFFVILDQADSAIGCLIAYKLLMPISWAVFLSTIFIGTFVHLFFNVLLFTIKLRKNPF